MNTSLYGMAEAGIVPVRASAADSSEMLSQLLLGETFRVLEETDRYFRIKTDLDAYTGWVSRNQVVLLPPDSYTSWRNNTQKVRSPYFAFRVNDGNQMMMVPAGASVAMLGEYVETATNRWKMQQEPVPIKEHAMLDTAMNFRGIPYLWGGRSDAGIDCSGFVQAVYALHGYLLPRDSWQQYAFTPIKSAALSDAEPGDLLFFSYKGDRINHVGFYLGDGYLLHASGTLMINTIDPERRETGRYPYNERVASGFVGVQSTADVKMMATRTDLSTHTFKPVVLQ